MHNHYSFIGGHEGPWRVTRCHAIVGGPVDAVQRLNVVNSPASQLSKRGTWVLQGFTSNVRYAERHEIAQLRARQDLLFEKIINTIHAHAPSAKICFNTNPGDTAEAVNRWI